jgi:hypothetical protein
MATNYAPYMAPGFVAGISDLMKAIAGVPVQMQQEDNRRTQLAIEQQRADAEKARYEREAAMDPLKKRLMALQAAEAGDPMAAYYAGATAPAPVPDAMRTVFGVPDMPALDTGIAEVYKTGRDTAKAKADIARRQAEVAESTAKTQAENAELGRKRLQLDQEKAGMVAAVRRAYEKISLRGKPGKIPGTSEPMTPDEIMAEVQQLFPEEAVLLAFPGLQPAAPGSRRPPPPDPGGGAAGPGEMTLDMPVGSPAASNAADTRAARVNKLRQQFLGK